MNERIIFKAAAMFASCPRGAVRDWAEEQIEAGNHAQAIRAMTEMKVPGKPKRAPPAPPPEATAPAKPRKRRARKTK